MKTKHLFAVVLVMLMCLCIASCNLSGSDSTDGGENGGTVDGGNTGDNGAEGNGNNTDTPHTHTEVIDEAVAMTCTADGLTTGVHCSVCEKVIIAQEVIPAAHTYGEWESVSDSDCFFDGEQKRVCTISECAYEDTKVVPKLEHSFVQNEETLLFSCEKCDARILNGHLYAAFDYSVGWYEAYEICDSLRGHLVTVTNASEQALMNDIISAKSLDWVTRVDYYYWAGGVFTYPKWEWTTGETFDYTNWGAKESGETGYSQWHLAITTNLKGSSNKHVKLGEWEDIEHWANCYGFICEWELDIEESEHFFTEWKTTTAPTCYADGEQYRVCTHCGLEETEVLTQLEHSFIFNEATGITACEHCSAAMYDGGIYKIFTVNLSWYEAYSYCKNLGGHLVTVTSSEEQTFLESYMRANSYTSRTWLGGYNDGNGFKWITGEEFKYNNWTPGQPNNDGGAAYFIAMNWEKASFGEWHDHHPYEVTKYLICEWEYEVTE